MFISFHPFYYCNFESFNFEREREISWFPFIIVISILFIRISFFFFTLFGIHLSWKYNIDAAENEYYTFQKKCCFFLVVVALIILPFLFSHDAGQFCVLYLRLLKTIAKRLNYKHGSVLVFQNESIVKLKQGAKKNNWKTGYSKSFLLFANIMNVFLIEIHRI